MLPIEKSSHPTTRITTLLTEIPVNLAGILTPSVSASQPPTSQIGTDFTTPSIATASQQQNRLTVKLPDFDGEPVELVFGVESCGHFDELRIVNELHKGSGAEVYKAQTGEGKTVVFKTNPDPLTRGYVMHELDMLKKMAGCPILLHPLMFGTNEQSAFAVFPFCEGGNLREYVRELRQEEPNPGDLKVIAATLLAQLMPALDYLHNIAGGSIVHNDIKLDNLCLEKKGDITSLRLIDCGDAIRLPPDWLDHKLHEGTKLYWPLERWDRLISTQMDIWNSGIVLTEILLGRDWPPDSEDVLNTKQVEDFHQNLPELLAHIESNEAIELLKGMLAVEPEDRPTAQQCLEHPFILKYARLDVLPEQLRLDAERLRASRRDLKDDTTSSSSSSSS